jgi:drug/metabolite transporter (DMT)-like permease
MNSKTLKPTSSIVRAVTLTVGLILSAFLTAHNLPNGSNPDFWTELLTGSGTVFVLYGIPYVLFTLLLRKIKSSRHLLLGAIAVLVLGFIMTIMTLTTNEAVLPEDAPIFDPRVVLVIIQISITVVLAGILKKDRRVA